MHELLATDNINSEDLEVLLKARESGEADFLLIDVREDMEYEMGHLKGVDMLKPTSNVQNVFRSNGHERVINHSGGIVSYRGEIEK